MTPGDPAPTPHDATHGDGPDAWPPLPASLPMADGQVHLARASARAAAASPPASGLPADEQARAARFRRPGPRARFVAGRVVLRELLRRCPDRTAADVPLTSSPEGKPRLPGPDAPRFSISHAGDVVLVAVGEAEVGVDVEAARPGLDTVPLAGRVFGPRAAAELSGLDPDARPAAFLVLWTRHEAALKCRGVGLAGDPREADGLTVHSFALPDAYAGAIAVAAPCVLSRWTWRP
jgi:4'-phosphopantetheinyl transferase